MLSSEELKSMIDIASQIDDVVAYDKLCEIINYGLAEWRRRSFNAAKWEGDINFPACVKTAGVKLLDELKAGGAKDGKIQLIKRLRNHGPHYRIGGNQFDTYDIGLKSAKEFIEQYFGEWIESPRWS